MKRKPGCEKFQADECNDMYWISQKISAIVTFDYPFRAPISASRAICNEFLAKYVYTPSQIISTPLKDPYTTP